MYMRKINPKIVREKRVRALDGWTDRIEINPAVALGKPVIRGTRLTVEFVLGLLGQGMESKEIVREFPQLEEMDVTAAIHYAHERVREERVYSFDVSRVPA